ncbi:hypothetical protein [Aliamphritea spongicola]|nr:hypothetical protein [Aliamphritea spongicola]
MQAISQPREQVQVISQHALAVSFFPDWMQTLEKSGSDTLIKVEAGNLHDAMDAFLSGNGDFLLSYASHEVFQQMQRDDIESLHVGTDRLVPVSLVKEGQLLFGEDLQRPVRLLSHPSESFSGVCYSSVVWRILPIKCSYILSVKMLCPKRLKPWY